MFERIFLSDTEYVWVTLAILACVVLVGFALWWYDYTHE